METHTEAPTFSTETYFAAMAMQGLLANHQLVIKHDHADMTGEGYDFYEDIAEKATIHAVCLIAELNK
jgi:hypothetical protein